MTQPSKASALERISGNVVTESVLTTIAAIAGGPIAPLLPVLAKSLAAGRQQARAEAALTDMQRALAAHEELVRNLSDEQYKLVNEAISAVFHTTQEAKLRLLRNVVTNALTTEVTSAREAVVLSRMVRDISVDEAAFLSTNLWFSAVQILDRTGEVQLGESILRVSPSSPDTALVSGLLSLGLLTPAESTWDGAGLLRFTPYAAKLLAVLRDGDA